MSRFTSFVFASLIALVLLNPSAGYCGGGWLSWLYGILSVEEDAEDPQDEKDQRRVHFNVDEPAQHANRRAAVELVADIVVNQRRCLTEAERATLEQCLDDGANVDARDTKYKSTCLMFAAQVGDVPTVELCVARGADALLKSKNGINAYGFARAQVQILRALIKSGRVDPNIVLRLIEYVNVKKERCFRADELEVLKELIAAGARVDACDSKRHTALMLAAAREDLDCVCVLLDAGADPCLESETQKTAFGYARKNKKVLKALAKCLLRDEPAVDDEKKDDKDDDAPPPGAMFGAGATTGSF